jgi:hypothetical protein
MLQSFSMSYGTTIMDVAKAAGVSLTTVSFVLNGKADKYRIATSTQNRIRNLIRQMAYQPDPAARAVALGHYAEYPKEQLQKQAITADPMPEPVITETPPVEPAPESTPTPIPTPEPESTVEQPTPEPTVIIEPVVVAEPSTPEPEPAPIDVTPAEPTPPPKTQEPEPPPSAPVLEPTPPANSSPAEPVVVVEPVPVPADGTEALPPTDNSVVVEAKSEPDQSAVSSQTPEPVIIETPPAEPAPEPTPDPAPSPKPNAPPPPSQTREPEPPVPATLSAIVDNPVEAPPSNQ